MRATTVPRPALRRTTIAVAVALAATGSGVAATTTSANAYWGPGYRSCGHFKAQGYRINVSAKRTRCSTARKIEREYWLGPRSRKTIVNGGTGASGYVLLKRYPGWKCFSGAGAGTCRKGSRIAAYDN